MLDNATVNLAPNVVGLHSAHASASAPSTAGFRSALSLIIAIHSSILPAHRRHSPTRPGPAPTLRRLSLVRILIRSAAGCPRLDQRAYPPIAARNFPLAELDFRYILQSFSSEASFAPLSIATPAWPPHPGQPALSRDLASPLPAIAPASSDSHPSAAVRWPPPTILIEAPSSTPLPDAAPRPARRHKHSMARTYADVNANMPRSYWDYDSVNISWGALENYEVVRKIGMLLLARRTLLTV